MRREESANANEAWRLRCLGRLGLGLVLGLWLVALGQPALAQNCVDQQKFPGVQSKCASTASGDEIPVTPAGEKILVDVLKPTCTQAAGACMVQPSPALCAGLASFLKLSGAYGCLASCEGGTPLSAALKTEKNVCPGALVCCLPKEGAKPAAKAAAPTTLPDPLSGLNFPRLLGNIIRTFAGISGAIALLMFVYGGIMWIISGGEKGKVQKARTILVNASIGLVLIFSAYALADTIISTILAQPTPGP